jgi:hypothetical protein
MRVKTWQERVAEDKGPYDNSELHRANEVAELRAGPTESEISYAMANLMARVGAQNFPTLWKVVPCHELYDFAQALLKELK